MLRLVFTILVDREYEPEVDGLRVHKAASLGSTADNHVARGALGGQRKHFVVARVDGLGLRWEERVHLLRGVAAPGEGAHKGKDNYAENSNGARSEHSKNNI